MRFLSLGSGSRGNATLLQSGETLLLVDCGFTRKELQRRLGLVGLACEDIDALLLTHEHADHVRGAQALSRHHAMPVWATAGTLRCSQWLETSELHQINANSGEFRIGDIRISPFTVPHDAAEPCQYVFADGHSRFGILTDTGSITSHILSRLQQLDALLLEFNHDLQMLRNGPYPISLQRRVGGDHGHLSNMQSAGLVSELDHHNWKHLVAAHISEKNNDPALVRSALDSLDPSLGSRFSVLHQDNPSQWFDLG
ncbi:MAG: MBL fold metallo-hydrolase [Gammaproteobacteria bacterium]|jgi:phosphoribosyl 1,2-cyclic phosphodiesterase